MHARVFAHKGRGLSGNHQHGNKGKDRPARIPHRIITFKLCFCSHKRVSISLLQTLRHRAKYQINEFTVTKC